MFFTSKYPRAVRYQGLSRQCRASVRSLDAAQGLQQGQTCAALKLPQ